MRRADLKKRNHIISGTPMSIEPEAKDSGRRGLQSVFEEKEEYDVAYDDFFEFQKDLDELEASNEAARRAEIYGEIGGDYNEREHTEPGFIVMEEDDEEKDPYTDFSPIIMEHYEEISAPTDFKRCVHVKSDGERCKRQAPKISDLCSAHRRE